MMYDASAVLMPRSEATAEASLAEIFERIKFGIAIAAIIRMIATTINNSISENPFCLDMIPPQLRLAKGVFTWGGYVVGDAKDTKNVPRPGKTLTRPSLISVQQTRGALYHSSRGAAITEGIDKKGNRGCRPPSSILALTAIETIGWSLRSRSGGSHARPPRASR